MTAKRGFWFREFLAAFSNLRGIPPGLWLVIGVFTFESMAYFGALTLMVPYLTRDLGWSDGQAGLAVSLFTMFVTLFMLGLGSYAEAFGLRRAIAWALAVIVVGRIVYALAPGLNRGAGAMAVVAVALLVVAAGEAVLQPVCYSGVKQFTDAKTHAMGYGLIYAIMNLGIVGIGAISAWVRPAVQRIKDGQAPANGMDAWLEPLARATGSGIQAVNWICVGLAGGTCVLTMLLLTRRVEGARLRPEPTVIAPRCPGVPWCVRARAYFTEGPFANPRFLFFVFMLLPVRTLFAHQWLTVPEYILRAYSKEVADRMEWLVNWTNPLVIFLGVPVLTALTRRVDVYTMMIVGTLVSAAPTYLLAFGPSLGLLIAYLVVFSVGEALWFPRFLEYAAELAPPGRVAQYMGLAQVPWLLAKGTTGFYSGYMLATFCPANTPPDQLHTGIMWLVYATIGMTSPLGLWLARRWVRSAPLSFAR